MLDKNMFDKMVFYAWLECSDSAMYIQKREMLVLGYVDYSRILVNYAKLYMLNIITRLFNNVFCTMRKYALKLDHHWPP